MTRWILFTIAVAVAACGDGERERVADSDAVAGADSAVEVDPGATETPTAEDAEPDRATAADRPVRNAVADTDRVRENPNADGGATGGVSGAEAMGGVRTAAPGTGTNRTTSGTPLRDLSADQVRRLQTALNEAGCNAGAADGVLGRQTRQAIACGLEKNDLRSDDLRGLYRALDLDFD